MLINPGKPEADKEKSSDTTFAHVVHKVSKTSSVVQNFISTEENRASFPPEAFSKSTILSSKPLVDSHDLDQLPTASLSQPKGEEPSLSLPPLLSTVPISETLSPIPPSFSHLTQEDVIQTLASSFPSSQGLAQNELLALGLYWHMLPKKVGDIYFYAEQPNHVVADEENISSSEIINDYYKQTLKLIEINAMGEFNG